jgi:hypothetical protein
MLLAIVAAFLIHNCHNVTAKKGKIVEHIRGSSQFMSVYKKLLFKTYRQLQLDRQSSPKGYLSAIVFADTDVVFQLHAVDSIGLVKHVLGRRCVVKAT